MLRAIDLDVPLTFTNYRWSARPSRRPRARSRARRGALVSLAALPWTAPARRGRAGAVTRRSVADDDGPAARRTSQWRSRPAAPPSPARRMRARARARAGDAAHRRARRVHPRVALGHLLQRSFELVAGECRCATGRRGDATELARGRRHADRVAGRAAPVVGALTVDRTPAALDALRDLRGLGRAARTSTGSIAEMGKPGVGRPGRVRRRRGGRLVVLRAPGKVVPLPRRRAGGARSRSTPVRPL